jgi:hypothetical protein
VRWEETERGWRGDGEEMEMGWRGQERRRRRGGEEGGRSVPAT